MELITNLKSPSLTTIPATTPSINLLCSMLLIIITMSLILLRSMFRRQIPTLGRAQISIPAHIRAGLTRTEPPIHIYCLRGLRTNTARKVEKKAAEIAGKKAAQIAEEKAAQILEKKTKTLFPVRGGVWYVPVVLLLTGGTYLAAKSYYPRFKQMKKAGMQMKEFGMEQLEHFKRRLDEVLDEVQTGYQRLFRMLRKHFSKWITVLGFLLGCWSSNLFRGRYCAAFSSAICAAFFSAISAAFFSTLRAKFVLRPRRQ